MNLSTEQRHGFVIVALLTVVVALIAALIRNESVEEIEPTQTIEKPVVEIVEQPTPTPILKEFDPNTVELMELIAMGVDRSIAVNLLRFRAAGKIFRIKEELIECRGFTDSLYLQLEPYITIGEQYRYKSRSYPEQQPTKIVKTEEPTISIDSIAKIRESHSTLRQSYRQQPEDGSIDLNNCDSATLVSLPGIGAKSAEAIIRYGKLLGGYHSVTQLFEIPFITEENFLRFHRYFFTNIVDISKIDVNFASAAELSEHPYFTAARVKRLTKKRNTKGGWSNIEEMTEDNIFTKEEAQHVHPYLIFSTTKSRTE